MNKIRKEIETELYQILNYWETNAVDNLYGGFVGKITKKNTIVAKTPKGSVLNSRILWTFSASYKYTKKVSHLLLAEKAFEYFKNHFIDKKNGGVFWTVDYLGNPLETKKQTYALSFAIYGLSEFYSISKNEEAIELAVSVFYAIEKHCYDKLKQGYFEAFTENWTELEDLRLSDKDANEKKTMNTHLHILEAYANLYKYWPNDLLKNRLNELLDVFKTKIINSSTHHLNLFMNEDWEFRQTLFSYGHDIEASWLLLEAAEILKNNAQENIFKAEALKLANASLEGVASDGSLLYEKDVDNNHLIAEKHWWVQAEAMVGFYNAYQISSEEKYLKAFKNIWKYINQFILDKKYGEWYWGRLSNNEIMINEDKVGLWKCPYHNARACLEILKRT